MNLNLFMAIFWMVLGAGLVLYHWMFPGEQFLRLRWTDWSPGWLILVLAVWNVLRWWSARAAEADRRLEENLVYERQHRRHPLPVERDQPPNPDFDFSSAPKPEPPKPTNGQEHKS